MDGGDWLLLAVVLGGGVLAYRLLATRTLWVPHLDGPLKVLGGVGFVLVTVGGAALAGGALYRYPGRYDRERGKVEQSLDSIWVTVPTVVLIVGAAALTVAAVIGRRRISR